MCRHRFRNCHAISRLLCTFGVAAQWLAAIYHLPEHRRLTMRTHRIICTGYSGQGQCVRFYVISFTKQLPNQSRLVVWATVNACLPACRSKHPARAKRRNKLLARCENEGIEIFLLSNLRFPIDGQITIVPSTSEECAMRTRILCYNLQ